MPASSHRWFVLGLAAVAAVVMVTAVEAQFRRGFSQVRLATPLDFDGGFQVCRAAIDAGGWAVDFPRADINVSVRLSELTKTTVSRWPDGEPKHLVVRLIDDELFSCPFVTPDHGLFRMLMQVDEVPQIPSINHWARTGTTSERGADSAVATATGIYDQHGRMMVLITHNTDLGDSWEREADDPQYFYLFSVPGYAFGINALLYALTH